MRLSRDGLTPRVFHESSILFFCSGVSQLKIAVTVEIQLSNLLDSHVISLFQLTVGGTLFDHKRIHKGTWHSPDGKTVNQIDHICISRKFNHSLLDVRSYRGADIGSDHYLVRGYLQVKLQSVGKQEKTSVRVPDIDRLRDKSRVPEYNEGLRSHFMTAPLAEKTLEES